MTRFVVFCQKVILGYSLASSGIVQLFGDSSKNIFRRLGSRNRRRPGCSSRRRRPLSGPQSGSEFPGSRLPSGFLLRTRR
ncbi:hypothetical protein SS50377_28687 [Spironucleus salmonicida]|uniref:Uncharacterized protein n=1 Tax=Spironucleus salmonicida TaxID=348837 RepID=A0A9P8LKK2_9EUKA|nr:hypothetical protein SS50377_28683 [Spironucleus salmonicida]KAH0569728.1 hypothetical protein SS50377_28687 [Spironucleus salmonicida]